MNLTQEIVEAAKELIRFETVESKPEELRRVIDFAEHYLRNNTNLSLTRFECGGKPSLVATFKKTKTPEIFFHDHLDVVPADPEQFQPSVVGGRLYGRGASDTKGNGAVLLVLAKNLSRRVSDPARGLTALSGNRTLKRPDVGFMFTTDEEIGGHSGTKYLLGKGYRCKFFVTLEPTSLNIVPSHKGILWLKIKVRGKSSHGSRPWDGDNAIVKAYQGFKNLSELYPNPSKPSWRTTVNMGMISGGDAFNKVPDVCEIKLDIRYIERDNPGRLMKAVRECFRGASVEVVTDEPAMMTPFSNPYIRRLSKAVEKVVGLKPEVRKGHGACDGRFYSHVGIPAVQFGTPSNGLHTKKEWLRIGMLEKFYRMLWELSAGSI